MKKVVIIGGGVAGLSAGIYARKAGFEAAVYEKNAVVGGQCTGWKRKGYVIDNCIHWLTGTKKDTPLYELWEDLGVLGDDIDVIQPELFYAAELNGQQVSLWRDLDKTEREMLAISPEDEVEIKKFISATRLAESMDMPIKKPMDMMNVLEYLSLGKSMSGMMKVMKEYGKINIGDLKNRFKHPLLKSLMGDYLPNEYVAFSLIVSYATITSGNGGIPRGGSLEMALRMKKKLEELGGKVFTNAEVKKVKLGSDNHASGIILKNGRMVKADYVICACDTDFTFKQLLDKKYMDKKMEKAYEDYNNHAVFSGCQVAFSVDGAFEDLHTYFFDCEEISAGTQKYNRMSIKNYGYEPAFAPKGKTIIQSNFTQYEEDYEYWMKLYSDKKKYQECKNAFGNKVLKRIEDKFPEYKGKLEILDVWTPATYNRYCNSYKGSYMSFITTKEGNNPRFKGILKGLDNVFIAGQWLMAPGGLPTAAATGKFSIQRILKKEKRSIEI